MRSLRFRLTLWFSLAVTITAGAAVWIGYLVVEQQVFKGIDFLLKAEIQEVVERLGEQPGRMEPEEVRGSVEAHTEIDAPQYYFQVQRTGRGVLFRSRNLGEYILPEAVNGQDGGATFRIEDQPVRVHGRRYQDLVITVATNLSQVQAMLEHYEQTLWLGIPVLFAASLLTGWLLSTTALRPVRAMQRAARDISASNLSQRLPVPAGADEIADLARLLNELFSRLEAAFEQVRRFTADASHELKTPLSLIRLHAERLAQAPHLSDADRAEVEGQIEEISRLNKLVESLLLLAKADAGSLRIERRWENPAVFIADITEDATALAEDKGRRVVVEANEPGAVAFDPALLRQVLLNVLSNAIQHTPAGKTIHLASHVDREGWSVLIDDEGPGVPADQLDRIFERFVRAPDAAARAPEGSGLGLAIARSIMEAHSGTIRAENRAAGGLRLSLRLNAGRPAGAPG